MTLTANLPVSDKPVFWMVLAHGELSTAFYEAEEAIDEAVHLTKKYNEPHVILKAVGIVRPVEVVTILEEIREWPADQ